MEQLFADGLLPNKFEIHINDKKVYGGILVALGSSEEHAEVVLDFATTEYGKNQMQIKLGYPDRQKFKGDDPRNHDGIRKAFETLKKLK